MPNRVEGAQRGEWAEIVRMMGDQPLAWVEPRPIFLRRNGQGVPIRLADAAEALAGPNPLAVNHKYGPELWDQLLEGVREIYEPEYVCVAGGAVRDHLLKVPPKDVDIFMYCPKIEGANAGDLTDLGQCLGWQNLHLVGNPGAY